MKRLLLKWLEYILMTGGLACLLLIPSVAWGASTDSYINFTGTATSGQSGYVLDNAALEQSGNSYFACGVRYAKNIAAGSAWSQNLIAKYTSAGDQKSWAIFIGAAALNRLTFTAVKDGGGVISGQVASGNDYQLNTNIHTAIGQAYFNNPGTSGTTLWGDTAYINATSTNNVNSLFDSTAPVSLGDAGFVGASLNGKIYQAWIAFADQNIITTSSAASWYNNPNTLPFSLSGVSRCFVWGPDGTYQWSSGKWVESGVSTGKTSGQFDMKFSNHPTYVRWKPMDLIKWAQGILSHWKRGTMP